MKHSMLPLAALLLAAAAAAAATEADNSAATTAGTNSRRLLIPDKLQELPDLPLQPITDDDNKNCMGFHYFMCHVRCKKYCLKYAGNPTLFAQCLKQCNYCCDLPLSTLLHTPFCKEYLANNLMGGNLLERCFCDSMCEDACLDAYVDPTHVKFCRLFETEPPLLSPTLCPSAKAVLEGINGVKVPEPPVEKLVTDVAGCIASCNKCCTTMIFMPNKPITALTRDDLAQLTPCTSRACAQFLQQYPCAFNFFTCYFYYFFDLPKPASEVAAEVAAAIA